MKVRDVMQRQVKACEVDSDLRVAGQILGRVGIGVLPVLNKDERVVGMVTDRDMFLALVARNELPAEVSVNSVMTRDVHTCGADDDVLEALDTMREHGVRRLPVVDDARQCRGILSMDDLVLASNDQEAAPNGRLRDEVTATLEGILKRQFSDQESRGQMLHRS